MSNKDDELTTLLVSNIELIGTRLDLINERMERMLKRVESLETDNLPLNDVNLLKQAVEEIQQEYEAPATRFTFHVPSVFNKKGAKQ
tara:strand:- start:261 stop:521 length:261 start_codon:yes stop_codon:yes gene_type:complete